MGWNQENRRAARYRLFQTREFERMSIRVQGMAALRANVRLAGYLTSANLTVTRLDDSSDLVANVAQFPDLTMAHVKAPRAEIDWPRDHQSLDRSAIVIAQRGDVRLEGEGVLRRSPGVTFVPPGTTRIAVSLAGRDNELVYASVPAALVADIPLAPAEATGRESAPLDPALVDPVYHFIAGVANTSGRDACAQPARSAAGEVVRALVRLAFQAPAADLDLFERATRLMASDLGDRHLSATVLAPRLNVSARRLQLEFQHRGTTVQRELRRIRTDAVRRARAENPDADVVLLAHAFGFGSRSALYRALAEDADVAASGERRGGEDRARTRSLSRR